jgi:kynureninase
VKAFEFQQHEDFTNERAFASQMDARDPLHKFRQRFFIPQHAGQDCVYLCGHSLGLQPKSTVEYLQQELADWAQLGVEGHFHAKNPWMPYHKLLTEQTANLVGAKPNEVVVMNSLTVNLHLMMVSFYRPTAHRNKILVERGAFPSDQYAVKSQIHFHGFDAEDCLLELTPLPGEDCLRDEEILATIERFGDQIALILLGGVNYATGQAFDMETITRVGHARGCIVAFDLAHAAGNLALTLHDWGADFAVWCSYKYLNGGPGCVAGCFVHERHAHAWDLPRFAGWWGHREESRFQMPSSFQPMEGAEGWQLSNPSILSMSALRASMDIFHEAGLAALRSKSISLTGYLEFLLNSKASPHYSIITPREIGRRGAQLSLRIRQNGRELCAKLAQRGIVADWREPDTLRVAPVPLYSSYLDAFRFAERFSEMVG